MSIHGATSKALVMLLLAATGLAAQASPTRTASSTTGPSSRAAARWVRSARSQWIRTAAISGR
jgi:hypothetical protein